MAGIDRREALAVLLAAVAAHVPGLNGVAQAAAVGLPLEPSQFLELSAKLCDMPVRGNALASSIQSAVLEQHTADSLTALAAILRDASSTGIEQVLSDPKIKELARSIISVWYSGLAGSGDKQRVITHEDALAWRATGYAKPPGTCGVFGDWTAKPAASPVAEGKR